MTITEQEYDRLKASRDRYVNNPKTKDTLDKIDRLMGEYEHLKSFERTGFADVSQWDLEHATRRPIGEKKPPPYTVPAWEDIVGQEGGMVYPEDWEEAEQRAKDHVELRRHSIGPDEFRPMTEDPLAGAARDQAAGAERLKLGYDQIGTASKDNLSGLEDELYNKPPEYTPPAMDFSVGAAVKMARDTIPQWIPGGTKQVYIEPPVEEFLRENEDRLEPGKEYTEHDMEVKKWRDRKWVEAYNRAEEAGQSIVRNDLRGGMGRWADEAQLQAMGSLYNIDLGMTAGLGMEAAGKVLGEREEAREIRERTHPVLAWPSVIAGAMHPASLGAWGLRGVQALAGAGKAANPFLRAAAKGEVVLPKGAAGQVAEAARGTIGAAARTAPVIGAEAALQAAGEGETDPKVIKQRAMQAMIYGAPVAGGLHVAGGLAAAPSGAMRAVGSPYHETFKKLEKAGVGTTARGVVFPREMAEAIRRDPDAYKEEIDYMVSRVEEPMAMAALKEQQRVEEGLGKEVQKYYRSAAGKTKQPIDALTNEVRKVHRERTADGTANPWRNNRELEAQIRNMFDDLQVVREAEASAIAERGGRAIVMSLDEARTMFGKAAVDEQLNRLKKPPPEVVGGTRELTEEALAQKVAPPPEETFKVVAMPRSLDAAHLDDVVSILDKKAKFKTEGGEPPDEAYQRFAVAARQVRNQFDAGPFEGRTSYYMGERGAPEEATGWAALKHEHDQAQQELSSLFWGNKLPPGSRAQTVVGERPEGFLPRMDDTQKATFRQGLEDFWKAGSDPEQTRQAVKLARMAGVERELLQIAGLREGRIMEEAMNLGGKVRAIGGPAGMGLYAGGFVEPLKLKGEAISRRLGSEPEELMSRASPQLERFVNYMLKQRGGWLGPRQVSPGEAPWWTPDFMPEVTRLPALRGGRAGTAAALLPEREEGEQPTEKDKASLLLYLSRAVYDWAQQKPGAQQKPPVTP